MNFNNKILSLVAATAIFTNTSVSAQEIMQPSGLDQIKEIVKDDLLLNKRVTPENIAIATDSITAMNALIKEAIKARALVNDGVLSVSDVRDINDYLVLNHANEWYDLRGQDAGDDSSGYYLVDRKRITTQTTVLNKRASRVWGAIYNLGFKTDIKNKLVNYLGDKSRSFSAVGYYLSEIMKDDIASGELNNPDYKEIQGTTNTKLDIIVSTIFNDRGLLKKISTSDMRIGAQSADKMNHLIVEAIIQNGLGNDKKLTTADIRTINNYLVANYQEEWAELHGDDEDGVETGYHRVQNDGAYTRMFADNVINSIADGIYHLGFETDNKNRLLNEDGDKNKRFEKVAWWLDTSLKQDLNTGKFENLEYKEVVGTTGTSLDAIVPYIYNNEGLLLKVSMEDIRAGAFCANAMNEIIVDSIRATQIAEDDYITADEVKLLNEYIVKNYANEWIELHGNDEDDSETGYHRIQNDGAIGAMHNKNVINKLADGIYHLGFYTDDKKRLLNEDGNKNVTFSNVAYWMNKSFVNDYKNGSLK